jgi:hypothetical protein
MFFPEFLFQLSARDQQVTWLDPFAGDIVDTAAAVSVTSTGFTVPNARAFLLQSASAVANPGAAQAVTSIVVSVIRPDPDTTGARLSERDSAAAAANTSKTANWAGSILVPPGWRVIATANFDAGVAVNNLRLGIVGLFIPIGNIQRI